MGLPVELKARAMTYVEAVQHGRAQRIFWEAIHHKFGRDEPADILQSQLIDAQKEGAVGDVAALILNLRRQRRIDLGQAAEALSEANKNVHAQYEAAYNQLDQRKGRGPLDWLRPRRWVIEANQADMEVAAATARARENQWGRYARQLQGKAPQNA